MMEQVEFSNVVVLNKGDLVDNVQERAILDRISILNPKAKVLKSIQSKIDVMEILNTHRFKTCLEMEEDAVMISATKVEATEATEKAEPEPECCKVSLDAGRKKCCKSKAKDGQLVDSGMSEVLLGAASNNNASPMTRHEKRFGISSFVYRARRPFHPGRLLDTFLNPYFIKDEIYEGQEKGGSGLNSHLDKLQTQASIIQEKRVNFMGELLRSKGFVWIATTNDIMGNLNQAGNIISIRAEQHWMCEIRELWEGTPSEHLVRKDMTNKNGEELPYADRRQELVFIGIKLKHEEIQQALDQCLLNDDEMNMTPDEWAEHWEDDDKIPLHLDYDEDLSIVDENEVVPEDIIDEEDVQPDK